MQVIHIERQILALTDDQLEQFVRQWTTHKNEYLEVQRFTGPGDMGRDVRLIPLSQGAPYDV